MRLMDGLLKITQFFMSFIVLWSQNVCNCSVTGGERSRKQQMTNCCPAQQSCQFLNRSLCRSLPMILNLG